MKYWRWTLLFIVSMVVVLSACSRPEADSPSEETPMTETPEPTATEEPPLPSPEMDESPLSPPEMGESPLMPPKPESPLPTPSSGAIEFPDVAHELRMKATAKMGISPDSLTVLSVEGVTWRDTSLGCPEPGQMYAQVLTDGWRAVYQNPEGDRIEVHATQDLDSFVICENPAEDPAARPVGSKDHPAVQAAVMNLARQLEVDAEAFTVESVEPMEWSDSCLGCGGKAESCLTVITPGYRVMIEHEGHVYEMRTDRAGRSVRLCERGGL